MLKEVSKIILVFCKERIIDSKEKSKYSQTQKERLHDFLEQGIRTLKNIPSFSKKYRYTNRFKGKFYKYFKRRNKKQTTKLTKLYLQPFSNVY